MKACRFDAILPGSGYRIDRDKCTSCGECVNSCYYGALVRYGREKTSEEVFEEVLKDKMFYDYSGGGVTVSGGEPLLYPEFVFELFSLCKKSGINTCIETCGFVSPSAFELVFPVTDYFYFDLKLINPTLHMKCTGCNNELIHKNARYIVQRGANVLFRQPLIPQCNDTDDNIRETAKFISGFGRDIALELMPFHRAGKTKYEALDMTYPTKDLKPMTEEQIMAVRDKYLNYGVSAQSQNK